MGGSTEIQLDVSSTDLQRMQGLYDRGLYLQAYAIAEKIGPLDQWGGTPARILAGRLAGNLGNQHLRSWLHIRAFKNDRKNYEAAYYYAWRKLERHGPLHAWEYLEKINTAFREPPIVRADALALQARVTSYYRDFETAEAMMREAEEIAPGRGWVQIERAQMLQQKDEHEQALAILEKHRGIGESFRSNVQYSADILLMLNRDAEALDLLTNASTQIESAAVFSQIALLRMEADEYDLALQSLDRMEALSPIMDKACREWLAARRCDAHYHLGQYELAAGYADKLDGQFYKKFAARLRNPSGKRVHLKVGFVRQHHDTCAPATLAALTKFWDRPVDHVELAMEICYGGTPDHRERNWAEQNGWIAREFEVTLDCAQKLLDRGIPFTLTTSGPVSAHLQAVIGYDSIRETLILRDPGQRIHGDVPAEEFLKAFASSGPRGMLMVPGESAHLLEDIHLPHADLYDCYHQLRRALHVHDRSGAEQHYLESKRIAPEHRITLLARRTLAHYDSNQAGVLASIEESLKEFPDDGHLLLWKGITLRTLARRVEYLDFLRELCSRKVQDPVFWREYAQALSGDARQSDTAFKLLRRALLGRPFDADNLSELASLCWNERDFARATQLYRFAACLSETNENYSQSYFTASRHLRQTDRALDFLKRRRERFDGRSSQPVRTLFWALGRLGLSPEAFQLLDEALVKHPQDGGLLLFASDAHGRHGRYDKAAQLLGQAESCSHRVAWLRQKADLAGYLCELVPALELWKQVLEVDPLSEDAHRAVARLLAETEDRGSAIAHLRDACGRFPHNIPLRKLLLEWIEPDVDAGYETAIRELIGINPDDAWTRREFAIFLSQRGRIDEAFAESEMALKLEPNNPYSHTTRSHVCKNAGQLKEAAGALHHALSLSVDTSYAMTGLLNVCETIDERRDALNFIKQELIRQVIFGDALLTFREVAYPILDPEELLASLHEAMHARADLWHAWSAVSGQLVDTGRTDDALMVAMEATARFPLVPRLWSDLATVHEVRRERAEQVAALQQALQINPHWSQASRKLAKALENGGDIVKARETMELAVARDPLDCINYGVLAGILWKEGAKEEAIARVERALQLQPAYGWAWDSLRNWTKECGRPDRAIEFARELTNTRPGDAQAWLVLAKNLRGMDERIEAIDKAIALNPKCVDAHDWRALLLAEAGRFDEAIQACNHESWHGHPPMELQGREAWLIRRQGRKVDASAKMRFVVTQSPGYYWGWTQLADWAAEDGAKKDYLQAAQQMVRLAPHNAVAHGYLGDAKLLAADPSGAKASFFTALRIDPAYAFGSGKLLELQLNSAEMAAASATLESIRKHIGGWLALQSEVKFAASTKRHDSKAALEGLRKLCGVPANYIGCLNDALRDVDKAGWGKDASVVLRDSLLLDGTNPEVGEIWVRRWTNAEKWAMRKQLQKLAGKNDPAIRAFTVYISILGEKAKKPLLDELLKKNRKWLAQDVRTWGAVGYAMACCQQYKPAIKWLWDWRERQGVQMWMVSNLITSLRQFRRYQEARELGRAALDLKHDHTVQQFQLWQALEEALAGNTAEADKFVQAVGNTKLTVYYEIVRDLATGIIKVQSAPEPERGKTYGEVRKRWNSTVVAAHLRAANASPVLRDCYRRSAIRIKQDAKRWSWLDHFRYNPYFQPNKKSNNVVVAVILAILLSSLLRGCAITQ